MSRRFAFTAVILVLYGVLLAHRYRPHPRSGAEQDHQPALYGGLIVPIRADRYYAEVVVEEGGILKLYTLGRDESRVIDVEEQTLTASVQATSNASAFPMPLRPAPQPGDAPGKTSLFVGQLPAGCLGQAIQVTVPALWIDGERFCFGFALTGREQGPGMPDE